MKVSTIQSQAPTVTVAESIGSNKTVGLYSVTQQASSDTELAAAPVSFISANRIVSVVEKAVERLGLLSLLDTTSPGDGAAAPFFFVAEKSAGPKSSDQSKHSVFSPRKASIFVSRPGEMSRAVSCDVRSALVAAAYAQRAWRPTVADLVVEQQRLERRYGELMSKTREARPSPNEPELDHSCFSSFRDTEKTAVLEELKNVSKKLRDNNKALFIQLKDNPNDANNWRKVGNGRAELIHLLQSLVREITTGYDGGRSNASGYGTGAGGLFNGRRSIVSESCGTEWRDDSLSLGKNRFGSTVQMKRTAKGPFAGRIPLSSVYVRFAKLISDEKNAQRWADELLLREKELNQNVKQLQYELKVEKILKEKEIAERQQRIARLKVKLQQEKKRVKEHSEMVRASVEAAHEARHRSTNEEERVVLEAMQRNVRDQFVEAQAHADFEQHLMERTDAMDELAVQWEKKNHTEIKRVEARKIDAEQMRQQCAERLQKAQKDKEVELKLKAQRCEEQQREAAEKSATEERINMEYEAVSVIQSAIRACFTREALIAIKKRNRRKLRAVKK